MNYILILQLGRPSMNLFHIACKETYTPRPRATSNKKVSARVKRILCPRWKRVIHRLVTSHHSRGACPACRSPVFLLLNSTNSVLYDVQHLLFFSSSHGLTASLVKLMARSQYIMLFNFFNWNFGPLYCNHYDKENEIQQRILEKIWKTLQIS